MTIENLSWKFLKIVHKKAPSIKADQLTYNQESLKKNIALS